MIYLDNAATSRQKPEAVYEAMMHFMRKVGASPGRSGHSLSVEAERVRFDARQAVADLFGLADPMRVVFTMNATEAINLVIHGLVGPGSHVIATSMEHNSVMRPIRAAEQNGAVVSLAPCHDDGTMSTDAVGPLIQQNTRLLVINHASNVCGTVLPIRAIGTIARQNNVPLLLDAAQTAGCLPIDMEADKIDLLAFSGHKGLLGPSGTGGLVIHPEFDVTRIPAMVQGGTGSGSEQETQPDFLPDKFESGTPNMVGIAGLLAGLAYLHERGVDQIREHERGLTQRLIDGLADNQRVRVLGTRDARRQASAISFTVDGLSPSHVAQVLDERFGIMSRPGMQCAPCAHRTLGTLPEGTVRLSAGVFTTEAEIEQTIEAVAQLTKES